MRQHYRLAAILVTGGAGFIGSHLVERLLEEGERIRILDNFSTGRRENLSFLSDFDSNSYDLIEGDLRDVKTVHIACRGIQYVLHQAALTSIPRSIADPVNTNDVSTRGTLNLLMAAKERGVKRVVYASSSSVYGDSPVLPKREEMRPNPLSPYAVSKLAGEQYCRVFTQVYGLETVSLRYFNVFGPRQDPISQYAAVIPKFITAMLEGKPPQIFGDGEQTRDFTYVENVIEANLLALQSTRVAGEIINIACGREISVNDLGKTLSNILGKDTMSPPPIHIQSRPGDVRHSVADISKAKLLLGYRRKLSLEEGLKRTVEWYKQNELAG